MDDQIIGLAPGAVRIERRRNLQPFPEVLSETAQLLLQDADADTLCQAVFKTLREPFGIDVYFHYLVAEDGRDLELASSGGSPRLRAALGSRLDFGSSVCGTVARSCTPLYVDHVEENTAEMTSFIREVGVRCYASFPLTVRGHMLGTLSFGSTRRDEFLPQELDLFALIAKQVTLATDRRTQGARIRELERIALAGRMSATLAHEINNPLESLGNLLFLLRDEIQTPEGNRLLHQAEHQVAQLSETAQHTMDLFRGKRQTPTLLDAGELARELIAGLHLPNHVRVIAEIDDELCVRIVPGDLRQVFFNLLMNAAQFSPAGENILFSAKRSGHDAQFRVRDFGEGISDAVRARIFQPFYTTRGPKGTGVGLWLSRELVERAGGRLFFHSDTHEEPGTEFVVSLPLETQVTGRPR